METFKKKKKKWHQASQILSCIVCQNVWGFLIALIWVLVWAYFCVVYGLFCLFVLVFLYPSTRLRVSLSVCLGMYMSMYASNCMSVLLCVCPSMCPCWCPCWCPCMDDTRYVQISWLAWPESCLLHLTEEEEMDAVTTREIEFDIQDFLSKYVNMKGSSGRGEQSLCHVNLTLVSCLCSSWLDTL